MRGPLFQRENATTIKSVPLHQLHFYRARIGTLVNSYISKNRYISILVNQKLVNQESK